MGRIILIVTFAVFSFPSFLQARHIIGGYISYEYLSTTNNINRYRITLRVFRDCGSPLNGGFDRPAERERAADIFLQVLEGVAWQAWAMEREARKQPPLENSAERAQYIRDTVNAVSDSFQYPAPVVLQLTGFQQVQATVLQATRSPGKKWVYLGSLLLVAGVFAMLYIRERRFFALIKRDGTVLLALASNRASLDVTKEFEHHRNALAQRLAPADQEQQ